MDIRESSERPQVATTSTADLVNAPKRISWAAIFGGAVVASVISVVLNLLGLGIGAATAGAGSTAKGLGIGAGIWTLVVTLASLFVGGWCAGRVSGATRRLDGALHGIIAWGLMTLFTLYMLGSAVGGIVGGAAGIVGNSLPAAAQHIGRGEMNRLKQQAASAGNPTEQRVQAGAEQAGNVVGGASIFASILFLLGGVAAAFGGVVGARKYLAGATVRQRELDTH